MGNTLTNGSYASPTNSVIPRKTHGSCDASFPLADILFLVTGGHQPAAPKRSTMNGRRKASSPPFPSVRLKAPPLGGGRITPRVQRPVQLVFLTVFSLPTSVVPLPQSSRAHLGQDHPSPRPLTVTWTLAFFPPSCVPCSSAGARKALLPMPYRYLR